MHIVIAEDDAFLLKVYTSELTKAGYTVTIAEDGEQLLEIVRKKKPDLLMLDILMPKKNGFEVLEEIHKDKKLSKVPIIMLTSLGQEEDIEHAKKLGAKAYFVKTNIDLTSLIELICTIKPPKPTKK